MSIDLDLYDDDDEMFEKFLQRKKPQNKALKKTKQDLIKDKRRERQEEREEVEMENARVLH